MIIEWVLILDLYKGSVSVPVKSREVCIAILAKQYYGGLGWSQCINVNTGEIIKGNEVEELR